MQHGLNLNVREATNDRFLDPDTNPSRFLCQKMSCILSVSSCLNRWAKVGSSEAHKAASEYCSACEEGTARAVKYIESCELTASELTAAARAHERDAQQWSDIAAMLRAKLTGRGEA